MVGDVSNNIKDTFKNTQLNTESDQSTTSLYGAPKKAVDKKCSQLTNNNLVLPNLIFAIGLSGLEQPLREAHKVGIPIVAVVDSDCNPRVNDRVIDYIIPGNFDVCLTSYEGSKICKIN